MSYYVLAIRESGRWSIAFGDYDRDCVEQERDDSYCNDYSNFRKSDCKILKVGPAQSAIEAAVAKLNRKP